MDRQTAAETAGFLVQDWAAQNKGRIARARAAGGVRG
jgi:hypothetical protein